MGLSERGFIYLKADSRSYVGLNHERGSEEGPETPAKVMRMMCEWDSKRYNMKT